MERTQNESKRQTIIRLTPTVINRLKTRAKAEKTSYNSLVERILTDYTKEMKSEEEILEEKKRTADFLRACQGIWEGPEYDGVEAAIKEGRTVREIKAL